MIITSYKNKRQEEIESHSNSVHDFVFYSLHVSSDMMATTATAIPASHFKIDGADSKYFKLSCDQYDIIDVTEQLMTSILHEFDLNKSKCYEFEQTSNESEMTITCLKFH